jgi:hypothetical protein
MVTLLDRIKPHRGLITAIARETSVTHGAVSQWLRTRVPAERVLDVERVTGIDRGLIRPDLYPPPLAIPAGEPPVPSTDGAPAGAGDIAPMGHDFAMRSAAG